MLFRIFGFAFTDLYGFYDGMYHNEHNITS